jgi:hypothetical protein
VRTQEAVLGALDAEADPLLKPCFIHSATGDKIMDFRSRAGLAVGQKGAGKSALYLMGRGPKSSVPTARLSASTHQVEVASFAPNYRHTATLLGFELRLEILRELVQTAKAGGAVPDSAAKLSEKALNQRLKRIGEALGSIESFSVDTPLFGIGLSRGDKGRKPLQLAARDELPELDSQLEEIGQAGAKCLLLIDDPEQIIASPPETRSDLIGALLSAASMMNQQHAGVFKVVVLLKSHVFRSLRRRFEDFDKLRQNFVMLRWTQPELDQVLTKRIQRAVDQPSGGGGDLDGWTVLADQVGEGVSATQIREFILDRLINGPRDLIWFAELILEEARSGLKGSAALDAAEARYSGDHVDALEREYGAYGFPSIDSVVDKIFRGAIESSGTAEQPDLTGSPPANIEAWVARRLRDDDLVQLRRDLEWLEAQIPKSFCALLYDVGVLGYRSQTQGKFILPFEVGSDRKDFERALAWRLNPGFAKSLGS